jgi:hypothetical protein
MADLQSEKAAFLKDAKGEKREVAEQALCGLQEHDPPR